METEGLIDISKFLESEIPDKLYHYTNLEGLKGIIQNGEVWLSNMYFLNDKSEYELGLKLFKEEIESKKAGFEVLQSTRLYLDALELAIDHIKEKDSPYILSLTKNKDLLSQWRAYTDNGVGVNLGFNKKIYIQEEMNVLPCVYNPQTQKELIQHIVIESIFMFVGICDNEGLIGENKKEKVEDQEFDRAISLAGSYFMDRAILACSLIKNSNFSEEEGWRILFFNKDKNKEINFLPKKYFLKPFIKILFSDLNDVLNSITLGPNPEKDLCELSIRKLLTSQSITDVQIIHSAIPYRN